MNVSRIRIIICLSIFVFCGLAKASGFDKNQSGDQSSDPAFTQSFFFKEVNGELYQVLFVQSNDNYELLGDELVLNVNGKAYQHNLYQLESWLTKKIVPIPIIRDETEISIYFPKSRAKKSFKIMLKPQRMWNLFLTQHTHLDIGFTEHQDVVWEKLTGNLLKALELMDETGDWPEESQFKWNIEQTAILERFIEYYPEYVDKLLEYIREGRIEVCGFYMNLLTELCTEEELIRALYPAEKYRKEYGISINTAMINDIPGYTWCLPQLFTKAGIESASFRANGVRAHFLWYLENSPARPFFWIGPDDSQVLLWYTDSYREGNFLRAGCDAHFWQKEQSEYIVDSITSFLKRIEESEYKFDAVQMRLGGDNLTAIIGPCQIAREWNKMWAYPKLIMSTNGEFFNYFSNHYNDIESYKGDIPDFWSDGAASSAFETAVFRNAGEMIVDGEILCALAKFYNDQWRYPKHGIDKTYKKLLFYNEHTWGASRGRRQIRPFVQEAQWATKSESALSSHELALSTIEQGAHALSYIIENPGQNQIIVFNTLSWERTDVVKLKWLKGRMPKIARIIDLSTGKPVPFQIDSKASDIVELVFIAKDVPSVGYKTYLLEDGSSEMAPQSNSEERTIGNDFYKISFDDSARVMSIIHRVSGKQIIDPNGDFGFNEYIYESGGVREKFFPANKIPAWERIYHTSEQGRITSQVDGPVVKEISVKSLGKGANGIDRIITLYSGIDRIEIENIIDKKETRDPEGVYFAFPFNVASPNVYIDIPGAVMQPEKDQLPNSNKDFYTLRHWAKLMDKDFSIALCCLDAPLISLFEISTERWIKQLPSPSGTLYSYAMNNYWFTNYKYSQAGKIKFKYTIQARAGKQSHWETSRFALESARPLIPVISGNAHKGVLPLERYSYLSVYPENVHLQTVKISEKGENLIIRLAELSGEATDAKVILPGNRDFNVYQTDLTENSIKKLAILKNNEIIVPIKPFGIETIRISTNE